MAGYILTNRAILLHIWIYTGCFFDSSRLQSPEQRHVELVSLLTKKCVLDRPSQSPELRKIAFIAGSVIDFVSANTKEIFEREYEILPSAFEASTT